MIQNKKLKIIWLQGVTCNGNSHSFFNFPHLKRVIQSFDFLYHPMLPSSLSLEKIANDESITCDILIAEGAIDPNFKRVGIPIDKFIKRFDGNVKYIIAVGTCASFGGIFSQNSNEASGILYRHEKKLKSPCIKNSRVINLPGCPIHPQNLATLLFAIKANQPILLDEMNREIIARNESLQIQMATIEEENLRLREEQGYLTIEDESKIHAVRLPKRL
ncbi:MAG TPA: hypothetical protein EYP39_01275, partial [Ghiorsea sp.]|nr:hypothetical protein [Ghiorsea sp.]